MKYLLTLIITFRYVIQYAQNNAIGIAAVFNPQTESFGANFRFSYKINSLCIVPQVTYYPSFNKIHEYYIGISFQRDMVFYKTLTLYVVIHGGYNGWINYKNSAVKNAKYSNWNLEGGTGLKTTHCIFPFIEYRYNIKWKETNFNLGFMYKFGCKSGKTKSAKNYKYGKSKTCPAYDF
ncbi:MAG: hypothetical protein N3A01_02730 [Bacteroidales bacterium]|nr:hypothetical protein [Bacteroidales bacterium]